MRCRRPTPRSYLAGLPPCNTAFYLFLVFSLAAGAPRLTATAYFLIYLSPLFTSSVPFFSLFHLVRGFQFLFVSLGVCQITYRQYGNTCVLQGVIRRQVPINCRLACAHQRRLRSLCYQECKFVKVVRPPFSDWR